MRRDRLSPASRFAIRFIRTYQLDVRHGLGAGCGDDEACSDYALRMFEEHGFVGAAARTIHRVAKCRPPRSEASEPRPWRVRTRRLAALVGVLGLLGLMGTLFSSPAFATVTPPCYGTANRRPFATITQSNPLRVAQSSQMNLRGGSRVRVSNYAVQLYYFGVQYGVRAGTTTANRWQGTFNTSQFLTRGTGHYIVRGLLYPDLSTTTCVATLYIDVAGDPLGSTAGQVGAGLTGAGILGMLATAVTGGKVPPGFESTTTPEDEAEIERQKKEEEQREIQRKEDEENAKLAQEASSKLCFLLAFPALLMTAGAMAAGGGASGAVSVRRYPRVPWRPRLSVVGIGSGILFGAGSGILLQQYGVIWPTLGIGISVLVGGIALGVMVPTLSRLRVVRKLNRRLDIFERRSGTTVWTPTHRVPADGMQVWDSPDPSMEAREELGGGVEVQLAEVSGDWAQVVAESGGSGWVDARELKKLPAKRKPRTSSPGRTTTSEEEQPATGDSAPADWYQDPSGEARLRYWDGTAWTDDTAD